MKIYEYDVGHMTKMDAKPIYGKNPRNRLTDFYKTWYVASGTPAHHDDIGLTLTYFTARSNFVIYAFL